MRLSGYRWMWVIAMFDLPTDTAHAHTSSRGDASRDSKRKTVRAMVGLVAHRPGRCARHRDRVAHAPVPAASAGTPLAANAAGDPFLVVTATQDAP